MCGTSTATDMGSDIPLLDPVQLILYFEIVVDDTISHNTPSPTWKTPREHCENCVLDLSSGFNIILSSIVLNRSGPSQSTWLSVFFPLTEDITEGRKTHKQGTTDHS